MHDESTAPIPEPIPVPGSLRKLSDVTCEVCGTIFRPRHATNRFCSRPCYVVWWKEHVKGAALIAANRKKCDMEATGTAPQGKGGWFQTESTSGRTPSQRRKRDQALLDAAARDDTGSEGTAWSERAAYWMSSPSDPPPNGADAFNARKIEQPPLVLNGHGVTLRIHQGTLLVRNGFTHYPQDVEEHRFFRADRKLPSRIIVLDSDGSMTFDVLAWLSEQQVPLVQVDWQGRVVSVCGPYAVPYDPALREAQLAAYTNGVGLQIATQLIRDKIAGCIETLLGFPRSPSRDNGLQKTQRIANELQVQPRSFEALRLLEARAALAYFLCWQEVPISWKGIGRKPIPQEWHRCGMRQGILRDGTNRHATHPMNAILNYAYAVLESQMRAAVVGAGLDPTVGYLHARQPNRLAGVYDMMEPLRPVVDRRALEFVRNRVFQPSDFVVTQTGVCRLHPQLARCIAALVPEVDPANGTPQRATKMLQAERSWTASPRIPAPVTRTGAKRGRPSGHPS